MRSSINSSDKFIFILFSVLLCFSGCAHTPTPPEKGLHPPAEKSLIAVFPIENLSGTVAPLKEIRDSLINALKTGGFHVLEEEKLEKFMAQQRIRYVGGLDTVAAQAFKKEIEAEAVLITSLELYSEANPPKIALTSRLVSTGDRVNILWMDGVGMAGDDSPGILGLGLIEDPQTLLKKGIEFISNSLGGYLSNGKEGRSTKSAKKKFYPKVVYRSSEIKANRRYTVAVLPFFNRSDRKNAGEIVGLHFVRELTRLENFEVIELGVVRQKILNARIIMDEGISLLQLDVVANSLEADLVITGKVMDYQDYQGLYGIPKVDFFVSALERKSRNVVWTSNSYNRGDDKVYFFDWGRVNTAHAMTSQMVEWVGEMVAKEEGK